VEAFFGRWMIGVNKTRDGVPSRAKEAAEIDA